MASSAGPGACYKLIPLPAALPAKSLDKKNKTLKLNKVVGQLNFRAFFSVFRLYPSIISLTLPHPLPSWPPYSVGSFMS